MDNIPTTDNDQMNVSSQDESSFEKTIIKNSDNLITNNARFSILAQIYQWQPTGILLRLSLPIVNQDNSPLFALRVSPFWIPLNYVIRRHNELLLSTYFSNSGSFYFYDRMRSWCVPVSTQNTTFSEQVNIPTSLRIIESDDMPDITLFALHHMAWTGTIQYMFKIISNTTTQGKIVVTRQYNVQRPAYWNDPMTYKTPLSFVQTSQSARRKNAFLIEDLAKTTDLQINCPWVDPYPFKSIRNEIFSATEGSGGVPFTTNGKALSQVDSWIFLDIIGALDVSAGSTSALIEFWIKAGPDFQLHGPAPIASHFCKSYTSYASDGRPLSFEQNSPTVRITSTNNYFEPA